MHTPRKHAGPPKGYKQKEKKITAETIMVTDSKVAELTGFSRGTLQNQRWRGVGIPYYRLGRRAIRYKLQDVMDFLEKYRVEPQN